MTIQKVGIDNVSRSMSQISNSGHQDEESCHICVDDDNAFSDGNDDNENSGLSQETKFEQILHDTEVAVTDPLGNPYGYLKMCVL